jgi:AcrR family transcriptional regulator
MRKHRKSAPALKAERRQAILDAALEVFAAQGFAAARLEDVARQAGVAKGTLYLYFRDKEELFEQILRVEGEQVFGHITALAADDSLRADVILKQILQFIQTQILGGNRERLMRILISEGHRFPKISELYYREIIVKGRQAIMEIARRGAARGELRSDALTRFPQLFFAPIMLAVVWRGQFDQFDRLDVEAMLADHAKLILEPLRQETP